MALTEPRPKPEYSCTQQELYQICLLIWFSYLENVADFAAENTNYDVAFGNANIAAVKAAKAMPDFQQRDEASETLGVELKEGADECLIKWQSLEGYIKKGFKEKLWKTKLEGAGSTHYEKAGENNWEEVSALMEAGKKFIADNGATLTSPGGMPSGFAGATGLFETARTTFDGLFEQFKDAQQDNEEQGDAKVKANNALDKAVALLDEDGQKIYRKNGAKRERFTFSSVKELVSGAGASTKTVVIAAGTSETVTGVRANSPITNISETAVRVCSGSSPCAVPPPVPPLPATRATNVVLNPDDVIANTFGSTITFTNGDGVNGDGVNGAEVTVRVTS
ncbi:MAG: hypothetical protein HY841_10040 [Bacteroidetes bacterium]|nr:hypothetical protein [Bacteroidota bacterium]